MDTTGRKEWDDLNQSERNTLMWPDFLQWGEPDNVEVCLKDAQTSLGLVSVAVQDPITNDWYHISKRIKENQPAQGHVKPYKWITKVNNKEANLPSEEFSKLFKNGQSKTVHLSMKTAVDPLTKFVKQWRNEKTITGNGRTLKEGITLVHFYSKEDEEIKDRILVWEVKPETTVNETDQEISLHRGDEMLAVNDEPVQGKKLAEIYKLISNQIPAEVKLKIKEIAPLNSCIEEGSATTNIKREIEQLRNTSDTTIFAERNGPENYNPTEWLIINKEMDENAGREKSRTSEVHENPISSAETKESHTAGAVPETTVKQPEDRPVALQTPLQEEGKKKRKKLSFRKRSSSSTSPSGDKEIKIVANEGYKDTPPPERKFSPANVKMCSPCVFNGEIQLSDDRNNWAILKMESGHLEQIYKLLDLSDRSKESLLSALGCFNTTESDAITQEWRPSGGFGIAKKALGRWGNDNPNNNVGALKKILKERMRRNDVLEVIERWEKLLVCHGCGVRLS